MRTEGPMSYHNIKEKLRDLKILIIGDLMVDHYMWGSCERISPEAPVPVVDIEREETTLGGAGNVLKNLLAFGVAADVVSVIGYDQAGKEICSLLSESSISISGVYKETNRHTSKKSRVLAAHHQMIRFDKETRENISAEGELFIINKVREGIAGYDVVLISDYLKGVLTNKVLEEVIKCCRENNKVVIVDPKGDDYKKYKGANIIKPNKKEAAIATHIKIATVDDVKAAAKALHTEIGCDAVIITLSEDGMAIYDSHFEIIPTRASEVFDVTGAGDTVLASLGLCIGLNMTVKEATIFANHAAAIVVSKVGSAVATIDEVFEHIENNS